MTSTHIDPDWIDPTAYVAFLNQCFPRQHWDRADFDWYVARAFNARSSERLVRTDDTRIVSGMTLCYRQIRVDEHRPIDVCVLSAGGTIPSERGRGHYEQLLRAAVSRAHENSCAALVGFVTRGNGSGKGVIKLGARALPSFYIVSAPGSPARFARRSRIPAARRFQGPLQRRTALDAAFAMAARQSAPRPSSADGVPQARFHYERPEDWRQQFIYRPHGVRAIRLSHDSLALIECVGDTDRLQWLACPEIKMGSSVAALAAASAAESRRFFMYTLDPLHAAAARRAGLEIRSGYLLILPTGRSSAAWEQLVNAAWRVQSGDRL